MPAVLYKQVYVESSCSLQLSHCGLGKHPWGGWGGGGVNLLTLIYLLYIALRKIFLGH